MAGISTTIAITDRVSAQLNRITASLYNTTAAFDGVDRASETAFNSSGIQAIAQELYSYENHVQEIESELVQTTNRLEEMENQTRRAAQSANMLSNMFKAVAGAVSAIGIKKILDESDELVQTTSRLNMMNDGLQTTDELVKMVYASAQNARGGFSEMADVVARFGNNAKDAFSSSAEVVEFANLIQKQMTIAGASTNEASNAMLQLSQALGSGVLRGDELNSIFEQAPNLIQSIADYLDVPIGQIREMASEGQLSADVVKAAIFASADDINAKFSEMPMTWAQVWQSMQNTALMKFQPVLQRLNEIANSEGFQNLVNGATTAMATVANTAITIFDIIGSVGSFVADNWSILSPIIYGVVAALSMYAAYLGIVKIAELASAAASGVMAVAKGIQAVAMWATTKATWAATTAQLGLNGAMYACPITWIIVAIVALIAVLFAVCNAIAQMTGIATSGFGVITGGVNVVIQFFKNLGLTVANIALGIGNAISAMGSNMMTAFGNAISAIQSWFYDLLSTGLSVIAGICEALNKLPFVEFDYSGITSAADDYAAKSAEAAGNTEEYTSVADAFNEGMSTFDTFQDGWVGDAFDSGAAWGDGIADSVSSALDFSNLTSGLDTSSFTSGLDSAYTDAGVGSLAGSAADTAGNTAAIADSMDITNENLKYLRDVAEQEVVNRFTTAEINVEMVNNNNVSSDMDLDGIITTLSDGVNEAMIQAAEGVH